MINRKTLEQIVGHVGGIAIVALGGYAGYKIGGGIGIPVGIIVGTGLVSHFAELCKGTDVFGNYKESGTDAGDFFVEP